MEKEDNYAGNFLGGDYSLDHGNVATHHQLFATKPQTSGDNNNQMVDYMLNSQQPQHLSSEFCTSTSFEKLSFADVMQFADLGPKLSLSQTKTCEEETGIDPVYFLKFPVLNERLQEKSLLPGQQGGDEENKERMMEKEGQREDEARALDGASVQLQFLVGDVNRSVPVDAKNKRKRPRTMKTSEEVESQRMTHIAVERNRRKQMNEHLRVLRSLMPGSYVQRGDQASIIGGAIEFVRELEQLLQCLESQKRRRLYGDNPRPGGDPSTMAIVPQPQPPIFPSMPLPEDQTRAVEYDMGLREEMAESKSCLADVEVRLLGFDAVIKILCRRQPGQLIKTIAALEELQLNILHTNITTIEQTVLYSFNVKVTSEGTQGRFSAEDMANSVQQIFSFIHTSSSIC